MSSNRFKEWSPSSFLNQRAFRCAKVRFLGEPTAGANPTDGRWRNLVSAWVSLRNTTRKSLAVELGHETAHAFGDHIPHERPDAPLNSNSILVSYVIRITITRRRCSSPVSFRSRLPVIFQVTSP